MWDFRSCIQLPYKCLIPYKNLSVGLISSEGFTEITYDTFYKPHFYLSFYSVKGEKQKKKTNGTYTFGCCCIWVAISRRM